MTISYTISPGETARAASPNAGKTLLGRHSSALDRDQGLCELAV